MKDPYLIPNTDVLKNRASVRDKETLSCIEADITSVRLAELITQYKPVSHFNFEALCHIHQYIFQEIYEWAGSPRVINIEKFETVLGGLSVEYSDCFDIVKDAEQVLSEMHSIDWKKENVESAGDKLSDFMAGLWKVHPFREGNTRTIITFFCMFIESKGIYVESDLFKDNAAYMRNALVAASAVFSDLGDLRNKEYLQRIVTDAIAQGQEMKAAVREQIVKAGLKPTEKNVSRVIQWNRKNDKIHDAKEIKEYLVPARIPKI